MDTTATPHSNTTSTMNDTNFFEIVTIITTVIGLMALVMNLFILIFICRFLLKSKNSFLVQLSFVSFIDAGSGLLLFSISQLRVTDYTTVIVCLSMAKAIVAFNNMSKGNILCICIQRYIFALHLRRSDKRWRTIHAVTIILVNVCVGVIVGTVQEARTSNFISDEMPVRKCSPAILNIGGNSTAVFFWAGLSFVLASDVLCVLTVLKLMGTMNNVRPVTYDSGQINTSDTNTETTFIPMRLRHRNAIHTVLIILIVFTISSLPLLTQFILQLFHDTYFSPALTRLLLTFTYVPVLSNPVLIMKRTSDLRRIVKEDMSQFSRRLVEVFSTKCPCTKRN